MGTSYPTPTRGSKLTVSYGLVNVGVKYAPIVREKRTKGHFVDPETLGPVKQQYVRESDGQVVKPVSAYDHEKGPIVLANRDALKSQRDGRLEVQAFVEFGSIDPLYFEQAYLVWPQKGQEQGYTLLCDLLSETGKALVGTAVLSKSTKAVVLRYSEGVLLAHACTYDAGVEWDEHALIVKGQGEQPASQPELVEVAHTLFSGLPDTFDFASVVDEYDERLRAAIEAEAAGVELPPEAQVEEKAPADLMAALVASVQAIKAEPEAKPKAKRTRKARA